MVMLVPVGTKAQAKEALPEFATDAFTPAMVQDVRETAPPWFDVTYTMNLLADVGDGTVYVPPWFVAEMSTNDAVGVSVGSDIIAGIRGKLIAALPHLQS
jgi:hypothetical protein